MFHSLVSLARDCQITSLGRLSIWRTALKRRCWVLAPVGRQATTGWTWRGRQRKLGQPQLSPAIGNCSTLDLLCRACPELVEESRLLPTSEARLPSRSTFPCLSENVPESCGSIQSTDADGFLASARVFGPHHRRYCWKYRSIYAIQLAQGIQFGNFFPDYCRQQEGQQTGKPRYWKALKCIKECRTLHFAQPQFRCRRRNIGQQLSPRFTVLGKVLDQQPHKSFKCNFSRW